jgi:hypothetical protein
MMQIAAGKNRIFISSPVCCRLRASTIEFIVTNAEGNQKSTHENNPYALVYRFVFEY